VVAKIARWLDGCYALGKESMRTNKTQVLNYFADVAEKLRRDSDQLRRDFRTHHPSAGSNREDLVAKFLRGHLPKAFGIDTGLILSQSGHLAREADLVIVDQLWNAPLHPTTPKRLWLAEAVYALIEVKTTLTPSTLRDAMKKCRRFKTLPRTFDTAPPYSHRVIDSMFVLWAFEGPKPETIKKNVLKVTSGGPRSEQPDFIVVPDSIIAIAGQYGEIARTGYPGSPYREQVLREYEGDLERAIGEPVEMMELGAHSLFVFLGWITSWLKRAGPRSAPFTEYLASSDYEYGRFV
jgi:hypothetical protein